MDWIIVLAFTEPGRRSNENHSNTENRGTARLVFLASSPVKAGLVGETTSLTELEDGDLKMQYDFRRVYATLLGKWLGIDSTLVLNDKFEHLDIL